MKPKTTGQAVLLVAQAAAALGLPERAHSRDNLGINIVDGDEATLGEFPYMISLSRSTGHNCGGVLLNAYTVITAAHCVVNTATSAIRIRAGSLVSHELCLLELYDTPLLTFWFASYKAWAAGGI
ncbi:unnamed protein product [Clonostachys rosea]|uniref:Peptidase S1 domain-containing protein n=1 Tax=Bionectria ochroleuca TaxID=29856 RepID=A0ABY6ULS2_BIOOC|nr:unnamed protein product [Clonostachys rosea]